MAQQDRHTTQFINEGDKINVEGNKFECTFVSYQERPKEGSVTPEKPEGEVERYNFTYSFRPLDDMDAEREETTVPEASPESEQAAPAETPNYNPGQEA